MFSFPLIFRGALRPLAYFVCSVAIAIATSSCALSPQAVTVKPELTSPPGEIPSPRTVALDVRDDRDTVVIGTRGGLYSETSTISTQEDIRPNIRQALTKALEKQGFRVVDEGMGGDVALTVTVKEISYAADVGTFGTKINVSASVGVTCRKGGDTLTSGYGTKHEKKLAKAPSAEDNDEVVNMVLTKSLDEMLSDRELRDFMSR